MRKILSAVLSMALLCLLTSVGMAQVLAGGSIAGTVTDSTGAVVPGANVTARNLATNAVYSTTSDNSGLFVFPIVKVGNYAVKAEKTGFAAVNLDNVTVSVGNKLELPIVFRVAGSKEEVNVSSEAPLIETERTSVAANVNERAIENLPTNGRNFLDFVMLTPGVVKDPNRGGDLSFAGMRGTANSLTVDGNDDNNSFYGQAAARVGFKAPSQFSQDAVQEFQVASNGYSAEIGRASGAVINAVTKSGGNQFHGDLFEFYRDQSMNAYDPFTKENFYIKNPITPIAHKAPYHFNQFGGSLGGPIWKDRLFFFFNVDDQRNSIPNAVTPPSVYVTPAQIGAFTPEQTSAYNYLLARDASWDKTNNQNSYLLKLDGNINSKNQVSARWNRQRYTAGNQETSGTYISQEGTGNSYIHTDNVNVSLTTTVTPKIVNQLRVAYLRDREPGSANSNLPEAQVDNGAGSPVLQVGENYFSPRETTIRQQQYSDNVTYLLGHHTLKVGGDAVVAKIKNYFPGNFSGQYVFGTGVGANFLSGLEDFGCSLAGLTPGTVVNGATCGTPVYYQAFAGAGTSGPTTHPDTFEPSFFLQDDYRVSHSLTLNLGVRYDYQGTKQSGIQNPTLQALGFNTASQKINDQEWAPRVGFAYDVLNNGKLVVRGGYGIFYGTTNSMLLATAMSNNGIAVSNYTFTGATVPTYPNILTTPGNVAGTTPGVWVVANNFRNPMVQQMNLGLDYALSSDVSFSAGYMRVKGDHLPTTADQNPIDPVLNSVLDDRGVSHPYYQYTGRLTSAFSNILEFQSATSSQYNALVLELKKRFTHSFQGSVNYTWAHAIDNNPDATAVTNGAGDFSKEPMYPSMLGLDRGNAGADVRHRLNLGYVYTPQYTLHNKVADAVLGNWSTSGILTIQSGLPYSAMISGNLLNTGNAYNVRDMLVPRNSLRMPGTWELDPRITRDIKLPREGMKISVFGEAFNLLNHFNVVNVRTAKYAYKNGGLVSEVPTNTNYAYSYFGLPVAPSLPNQRILQLGAKLIF